VRKEIAEELNIRNKIIARRLLIAAPIRSFRGHDRRAIDSHHLPPIEKDESSEEDSSSKGNDKIKEELEDDDSQDHMEGLGTQSKGVDWELQDWMKENPVACNNMHEMDAMHSKDSLIILGCNGDRSDFKDTGMMGNVIVLKASR